MARVKTFSNGGTILPSDLNSIQDDYEAKDAVVLAAAATDATTKANAATSGAATLYEPAFSMWTPTGYGRSAEEAGEGPGTFIMGLPENASSLYGANSIRTVGAGGTAHSALYLNPADFPAGSRTVKMRIRAAWITNAQAPGTNFTIGLYPVTGWGGAAGATSFVNTIGAATASTATLTTPAATSTGTIVSADFNFPTAGFYVLCIVTPGTANANSRNLFKATLQYRQV